MFLTRPFGAAVALTLLAAPAFAQQTQPASPAGAAPPAAATHPPASPTPPPPSATHPQATANAPQHLAKEAPKTPKGPSGSLEKSHDDWRAGKLVGATVYNDTGDSIGSIDDLLIDTGGKVKTAVISVGGFLGIGSKLVSVSYDQLKFKPSTGKAEPTSSANAKTPPPPPEFSIVLPGATKDSLTKMSAFKYKG